MLSLRLKALRDVNGEQVQSVSVLTLDAGMHSLQSATALLDKAVYSHEPVLFLLESGDVFRLHADEYIAIALTTGADEC